MYRVLLVEDEEIELETLRDYIDWKKNGISRVFTARNGRRALECLEENMADIVITDIQMPGMSGIELAETIVRRGYPCKIVFLTGYDDFSYIHSAFQVNAVDYLLKPFTIEEVEACLKKVRSELEKSEIADWSRKTAAKQLLEMALREKQETELLRKNFRGVFGEELEECRFGIIAVYGKTEENICSQIQEKYKGIRYISKTERISILLLAGYLSVKDTAFQIWNDLKEDAPRAVGWCSGTWTADCLYEKAEKLRNCCVLAFHMDPPELFCADEKETEEEKAYHFREQKERREEICRLVSNGKKQETLQTMKDYFQQLKGLAPKTFAGEVYNLYMYLWNRLVLSDELLDEMMERFGKERQALEEQRRQLLSDVSEETTIRDSYRLFFDLAKRYSDIETLDRDILHAFIERIEIGEKILPEGKVIAGPRTPYRQSIRIFYRFIGEVAADPVRQVNRVVNL